MLKAATRLARQLSPPLQRAYLHYKVNAALLSIALHHQELVAQVVEAVGALPATQRCADVHAVADIGQVCCEGNHIKILLFCKDALLVSQHVS